MALLRLAVAVAQAQHQDPWLLAWYVTGGDVGNEMKCARPRGGQRETVSRAGVCQMGGFGGQRSASSPRQPALRPAEFYKFSGSAAA